MEKKDVPNAVENVFCLLKNIFYFFKKRLDKI